jgi:ubiquitin carboxyl-terminal hydrolase 25
VNSYDQALAFLAGEQTTGDDFIITLFTAKASREIRIGRRWSRSVSNANRFDLQISEYPTEEEKARKAVKVIAEARNSKVLLHWLNTGKLEESHMDVGEAYQTLLISDRTIDDDDLIKSQWEFTREDRPGQVEQIDRAMSIIAASRQSATLLDALRAKGVRTESASEDWPVGLENIGNTCYLNSLLQFLFTIPKLRNLVLHFDDYRVDLSNYDMAGRRVGSRHVTVQETEKAQKRKSRPANLAVLTDCSSCRGPRGAL